MRDRMRPLARVREGQIPTQSRGEDDRLFDEKYAFVEHFSNQFTKSLKQIYGNLALVIHARLELNQFLLT
jgi:hypothetical protein